MSKPSDQIETIVDAALDLPLADRAAYLDQACGGDASLRQSVEALLRAHRHVPSPPAATIKISADVASEAPGDRIGPYKLLQQLGEGGCGVVYMAEQEEPVRRRVALKVIKPGMDTKQVIARFEAERQALALMDHPNIAKVLDAGASETGRPYFVMELVRGVKITDYCDQNNLPTQQRLELFIQVCKAVQHAHQKGIIHRDLKPSNILVTLHDGVPVPKVIDFGIAKATEQRLTDKTLFTALQQFIGTPAYMSPEQAEMSGLDIDTRSDIYSLGVLLYELLTSRIPFDPRELVAAGLDAMRKIIRENEPVRPSTKLNTLTAAEQSTVAKQRQVEAPKLVQLVRGDLDWIVMKCLEKDRTRRYETANGLAMDIRRHLENEPVVACPPSAAYRLQKLVRRNKPAVAAVGAVVTALVIGLGISAWQYVEKSKAYTRAVAAEKLADGNARAEERQRRLAEENAGKAQQAAKLEAEQRVRAEQLAEENRLALYTANIRVAERMVKEGDVNNAAALLDSLRPNVNQSDLRGFEWYFLWRQLRAELFSIKHPNRVLSCAFSSDGNILATAGERGVIRLSNPTNGVELARLTGNSNWVTMLTFSSDSRTLAACGEDGRICIWSLHEPGSPKTLQVTNESFGALAFSADGNYLAAGEAFAGNWVGNPFTIFAPRGSPGRVYVWDAQTFKLLWSSESQTHGVRSLTFSKNGKRLASAGLGDSVKLHDALTGRVVAIQTNFPGPVFVISHLANDNEIAAGSWFPYHDSGEIKILDAATLEIKRTLVERAGKVLTLASSPDGSKLVSGGADGQTRLWDTDSGTELATFAGSDDGGSGAYVSSVGFSPDGERLAASTWDGVARVWNIQDGGPVQRIRTSNSFSVAFSPDSSLLASAGRSVEIRNPKTGRLLHVLPGYSSTDIRLAFAPDGSVLAAIDFDSRLNFWDVKTWRRWTPEAEELDPTTPTPAHFEPDTQFAFSPDSQTLAMCGHDKLIRFWSVKTGRLLNTITNGIRADSLAFTPDGRKLISGSLNDTSFWDIYNNQREFTLGGQGSLARISQDGRWLAHGGGSIQLRDLTSMRATFLLRGHSMQTYGIAFSHDSRDLATASWDTTVKLWHIATGQELMTIPTKIGVVWSVAFAPDDRTLAIGCGSSVAKSGHVLLLRAAPNSETDAPARLLSLLSNNALAYARGGRWTEAKEHFSRMLELNSTNYIYYHWLAPVLVARGDLNDYRHYSRKIQNLFAETRNPTVAERMAKACLILPNPELNFGVIDKLAATAATANSNDLVWRYGQFVGALAALRQRNYSLALQRIEPVLHRTDNEANLDVCARMVLAMSYQGESQRSEARAALSDGLSLAHAKLPTQESGSLGSYWNDWVISQALLKEAKSLIEGTGSAMEIPKGQR